jgi:hypothetical protein
VSERAARRNLVHETGVAFFRVTDAPNVSDSDARAARVSLTLRHVSVSFPDVRPVSVAFQNAVFALFFVKIVD